MTEKQQIPFDRKQFSDDESAGSLSQVNGAQADVASSASAYVPRHAAPRSATSKSRSTKPYAPRHAMSPSNSSAPAPAEAPSASVAARPSVARSTMLMALGTLGSRATGLIRTFAMAAALGLTMDTSAYQMANNLPNLLFDLVAGGLLNAAFVPLYLLQKERFGKEGGNRFASNLLNIIIIIMGALTILATIFAEQFIMTQSFLSPPDSAVKVSAIWFFRIFAVQIVFYGLGGVFTSILNANRVFFVPSIAPMFNNLVVIASFVSYMFLFPSNPGLALVVLAVGTTLGVAVQFAVQIPALIKIGFKYVPRIDFKDPGLIATLKTGLPMLLYLVGTIITVTLRTVFGLVVEDEGPATLNYAWTWFQLPHGIIAVSLARALFTEMGQAIARDDMRGFKGFLHQGISGMLFLVIPLAGIMFVLASPLMQIFQVGAFNAEDVVTVSSILSLWVLALPFYSLQLYLFNVFASLRRFGLFAVICTAMCVIQWGLYALLTINPEIGLVGIPIADIAYYLSSTVVLLVILRRTIGQFQGRASAVTALKTFIATLVGVALIALASHYVPLSSGIVGGLIAIIVYGGIGLVIIFALCKLMRVSEMALIGSIAKRMFGRFKRGG